MRKIQIIILIISIIIVPVSAFAGVYGKLKLGGYFPQSEQLKDTKTQPSLGVDFGYYFNQNVAIELEIGTNQCKVPVIVLGEKLDGTYRLYDVGFNLLLGKQFGPFKPYIKAGVGYYMGDFTIIKTNTGNSMGGQVGAGFSINGWGLEGKYVSVNPEIGSKKLDSSGAIVTLFWLTDF
jgi:opacity protein-like surface antigen